MTEVAALSSMSDAFRFPGVNRQAEVESPVSARSRLVETAFLNSGRARPVFKPDTIEGILQDAAVSSLPLHADRSNEPGELLGMCCPEPPLGRGSALRCILGIFRRLYLLLQHLLFIECFPDGRDPASF